MRYLILTSLLIIASCRPGIENISNQIPLEEVVSEFPRHILSVKDPLFVTFRDIPDSDPIVDDAITLFPEVAGQVKALSPQSYAFYPDSPLEYGRKYELKVALDKIYTRYSSNEALVIPFSTKSLEFSISPGEGLIYNENDVTIEGTIFSSDWVLSEIVEAVLSQSNNNSNIDWSHSTNGKVHNYSISEIPREEIEEEISLFWKSRDRKFSGGKSYKIKPKGAFDVTTIDVSRENRSITISFSDPVQENQRIEGLVTIEGEEPILNYSITGSTITVYLNTLFSDDRKLTISSKIKSAQGGTLDKNLISPIQFDPVIPQVRLIGNGVITPYQEEVIFPFEAKGLNAVDVEVFKIFENNVLQYLQNNRLSDRPYYLEQVGRIIHQEKVGLSDGHENPEYDHWSRYVLDLQQLTDISPGALYVIRVGFRQEYTDYPCEEGVSEEPLVFNPENPQTIMRWNYNYNGYRYDHESNPCYPVFYNENRFIQRNVLASNLGLIAKKGEDGRLSVHLNNLNTLNPVSRATVSVYDYQKQLIVNYSTDDSGKVVFELPRDPSFLVVNKERDYAYLNIMDRNANSLSDFDIGGLKKVNGTNGIIYGERGVWRPGDTMFLTFVLEENNQDIPEDHPVTMTVTDARGQMKFTKTSNSGVGGMYSFKVPTDVSDNTGAWNAIARVGGNTYSKRLRVETIKPNRLKINLEVPANALIADGLNIPFSSSWLHGAPANQLSATVEASFSNATTSFPSFGSYQFVDPARKLTATSKTVFNGILNNEGSSIINIDKNNNFLPPGKVNLRLKTRVYEPSGEYSEDNINAIVNPYESYIGIKSPESRWGYNILEREGTDELSIVVVDIDGNPLSNRKVNLGLYEAEWQWWYSRSGSSIYRYDASNHLGALSTTNLQTDKNGLISWRPESLDGYRFLVRACDDVSGHCSGLLFYTSMYEDQSNEGGATILRLTTDKNNYEIGENIHLTVPSNENSKILISLEGGNGTISESWYEGKENSTEISIPVDNGMAPNIYVHVMLLQKQNDRRSDLPLRMYGVKPISITDVSTSLHPEITAPSEINPKKGYTIEVAEKDGKAMNYTLAVVDQGLLGLTRYKTPDLHRHFYAKQSLGVKTWDLYDMVLQGYGNEIEKYISIGGDAEIASDPGDRKSNRFVPIVDYLGPFSLNSGEKKTHNLSMGNYIGEVRVMVVAKEGKAYGSEEVSIPVTNNVMVLATIPRVLSPEEEFDLPISVFATNDRVKEVNITLDLGPGLSTINNKTQRVTFDSPGDKLLHFPVKVSDYQGPSSIKVTAISNRESIDQLVHINISNPNPFTYKVIDERIDPGKIISMPYSPIGISGTNSGTLELSTFPAINLDSRLDYLIRYPYGCIEQTTSSVFPQLYLDNIVALNKDQKNNINKNIQNGITRIISFQQKSGGLSYWKGSREISEWGTSYAGHFLVEASEKGYFIPDYFWQEWVSFQKKMVKQFNNTLNHSQADLMQAYRLYTLSKTGNPEWAAMNYLRNEKLDNTSLYILAAAYSAAAKPEIAKLLIEGRSFNVEDYQEMAFTYGSSLRDKALVAESFLNQSGDIDENTESLVREVATSLGESSWYSTQTTAFALLAVGKYLSRVKVGEVDANVVLNNGISENIKSSKAVNQRSFEIKGDDMGTIVVTNNSKGTIYARVVLRGQEPYSVSTEESLNLKMIVRYTDINGKALDISNLTRGSDFISEVTVINPGTRNFELEELALTQVFPSGWEIQNDRISGNNSILKSDNYDYIDIRDDRVNIFFDLKDKKTFRTLLTSTYSGNYFLPDIQCSAMYDQKVLARRPGKWVSIKSPAVQ